MIKASPLSRELITVYILSMFFYTANSVLTVVLPLESSSSGMSEGEIGVMMGAYMLTCMLLRPWAGQLIGRWGVLTIMKLLLLGHAASLIIYMLLDIEFLIVVRMLQGAVTAFFSMCMQIGIAEIVKDEDRGQGLSLYSLSTVLPGLYGPVVALLLWEHQQSYSILIVALIVVPLLFLFKLPFANNRQLNAPALTFTSIKQTIQGFNNRSQLYVCSFVMLIGAAVFGAITTFLPLHMLHTSTGSVTWFLFLQAIVVVGSRFLLRKKIPSDGQWHTGFISCILICMIIGTTLLVFMDQLGSYIYIAAIFNGLAVAMLYPTLTTYLSFVIPAASRSIMLGIFLASYDLGFSLGGLAMGFVAEFVSYEMVFLSCTFLALIALLIVWYKQKQMLTKGNAA